MKKITHFGYLDNHGWPNPTEFKSHFLGPHGPYWFPGTRSDSAALCGQGADGTEHLPIGKGRIDIELEMWRNPDLGVLLIYSKWGGGYKEMFTSKGDLSRLHELVEAAHGTPLPVGLFVPIEAAWQAVEEFIETDGELPRSITWIANRDLPPNTFPDP
jgi:Immunity protein Imm1